MTVYISARRSENNGIENKDFSHYTLGSEKQQFDIVRCVNIYYYLLKKICVILDMIFFLPWQ